jgi:NADPH2:quinone reductase
MKAILCHRHGTPDDLRLDDIPQPHAGKGQVVVKIAAAALNFFDTLIIAGKYQIKPDFPFSPAAEFAGTVHEIGAGVTGWKIGDRVMSYSAYGAAREFCVTKASRLVRIPDNLDFERAAGLSVTYGTTIHALKDRAQMRPGEKLAVLGAAGGVGLAAIEIGKLMGAHVIACASSDEKCEFARQRGADEVVNYGRDDLRAELKRIGGANGIDVIYDSVGGPYAEPALRSIGWKGRYLVIGFAAGDIPKIPLNLVLLKGCDVVGVHWGAFVEREPELQAAEMTDIVRWCAEGKLSAHVHAVYPLADTPRALKDIAARKIMGKAILKL